MADESRKSPAELAAELIAADRPSTSDAEEPIPTGLLGSPLSLLLHPILRRNRRALLPLVLAAAVVLVLLAAGCGRGTGVPDRSAEAVAVCQSAVAQRLATDARKLTYKSSASRLGSGGWDVTGTVAKPTSTPVPFACGVHAFGNRDAPLQADGVVFPTASSTTGPTLTHDQYQAAIITIIGGRDAREATRLYTDVVAHDYESGACSKRVLTLQNHLKAVVDVVAALKAPADAVQSQRDFVRAATESVREVGVAASDVGSGDLKCGAALNRRIYGMPSTKRAEAAIVELEQRGYVVFGE